MNFLTPVKVPVKVYLSTDKDAPKLDRTPNCVATILKACLVTGYGDKQPAGWSLAFEDNPKGVKVLKPADSPHTPFLVRLSADTGREMTVQVYSEMSDIDTGELKLQLPHSFKYGIQNHTGGKWAVIASTRSVIMFCQTANRIDQNRSGTFLFLGDTAQNTRGERAVFLHHTSGNWYLDDSDRFEITSLRYGGGAEAPRIWAGNQVGEATYRHLFDGTANVSTNMLCSPLLAMHNSEIYPLPFLMSSRADFNNYHVVDLGNRQFMVHSTATQTPNNVLVPTDYWEL